MPLLAVKGSNSSAKVLVNKSSVEELITSAQNKLKLPEGEYRAFLSPCGALIDEDELLGGLTCLSEVVLLPKDVGWQEYVVLGSSTSTPRSTPIPMSTPGLSESVPETPRNVLTSSTAPQPRQLFGPPIHPFPTQHLKDLEMEKRLSPMQRTLLIHNLANSMHMNNDYSRGTCVRYATFIRDRYPKLLEVADADGTLLSNGVATFISNLYERVNNVKPKDRKRKRTESNIDNNEEDEVLETVKWPHRLNPKYDSYGCVAWGPPLPEGETVETQEEKRVKLVQLYSDNTEEQERVKVLMDSTYATTRKELNYRVADVQSVLDRWPFLKQRQHFQLHVNELLGKDVFKIWNENLDKKGVALFYQLKTLLNAKKRTDKNATFLDGMIKFISSGENAATNLRCETPKVLAAFFAIAYHFEDDIDVAIKLVDEYTSVDAIKALGEVDRPILILKGQSLYDEGTKGHVVCEGEIIFDHICALDGIILLFLSYYAFNYNYPSKAKRFLEFVQRVMLLINPGPGHKRGPKSQRLPDLDTRVKKIAMTLNK